VVVAVLSGSGDGESDSGWMPSSDTCDFSESFVGFSGKAVGAPTGGDAFVAFAFGGGDGVDEFVLGEDGFDGDFLFKEGFGKVDFFEGGAAVDLDFHYVGFFLAEFDEAGLGVGNDTDYGAVFFHSCEFTINSFSFVLGPFLVVLGECLSFASVPVLVHASQKFFRQIMRPDCS